MIADLVCEIGHFRENTMELVYNHLCTALRFAREYPYDLAPFLEQNTSEILLLYPHFKVKHNPTKKKRSHKIHPPNNDEIVEVCFERVVMAAKELLRIGKVFPFFDFVAQFSTEAEFTNDLRAFKELCKCICYASDMAGQFDIELYGSCFPGCELDKKEAVFESWLSDH